MNCMKGRDSDKGKGRNKCEVGEKREESEAREGRREEGRVTGK